MPGIYNNLVEAPGRVIPDRIPEGTYAFRLEALPEEVKDLLARLPR